MYGFTRALHMTQHQPIKCPIKQTGCSALHACSASAMNHLQSFVSGSFRQINRRRFHGMKNTGEQQEHDKHVRCLSRLLFTLLQQDTWKAQIEGRRAHVGLEFIGTYLSLMGRKPRQQQLEVSCSHCTYRNQNLQPWCSFICSLFIQLISAMCTMLLLIARVSFHTLIYLIQNLTNRLAQRLVAQVNLDHVTL